MQRLLLGLAALALAGCGDSNGLPRTTAVTPAATPGTAIVPPVSGSSSGGTAATSSSSSTGSSSGGTGSSGAAASSSGNTAIPPVAGLTDGVWMKGDLHIHSRHSNDSTNNPVAKIVALAETVGMDYLAITDHDNHVGGDIASNTWADPEFTSRSVLLLYSAEWTTHRGHGTPLSAKPYDHQRFYDVRDQRDTMVGAVKKQLGLHLSANHPGNTDHFGFSYDIVDSMEVWNSSIWTTNATSTGANSVGIWDDMLKSGRRITARGGSDSHHGYPDTPGQEAAPNNTQAGANNVGTPTTWVFGTARNADAVIAALTNGRASISANPFAPRVELTADLDGDGTADAMMGDNVRATGRPVRFTVRLVGGTTTAPGAAYTVLVTKDGGAFGSFRATGMAPTATFTDTPAPGARSYYRVQVEGPGTPYPQVPASTALSGNMVALSNPIFFNFDPAF